MRDSVKDTMMISKTSGCTDIRISGESHLGPEKPASSVTENPSLIYMALTARAANYAADLVAVGRL